MIISLRNDIDEKAVIKSHDDCLAVFKTILNKCDRNKTQKHSLGGSYRTKDGWVYFIQPLKSNPDCKSSVEPAKPPVSKKCRGVNTKKYLNRKTLAENIKTYCAEVARQGIQDKNSGSLERKYNTGTMEEVSISMHWPSGLAFKLREDECYMADDFSLGCDGNDPENPMNWKAGGSFRVGKVEYVIQPMATRPTAPKKTWAHCKTRYDFLYDSYWIQGGGWGTHDSGKGIKAKLNGCAGSAYHFKYETDGDGKTPKEWSISGRAPIWKKKCITKAIKSAGGPSDIKCSGSG
ncbi:hypothetical protein B0O99DRAFT_586533 [Bisporella sp. PMI_857]|nr:hypothetical protein B0O99DRAFT_586533 [Bisporella sp. PMI_857]